MAHDDLPTIEQAYELESLDVRARLSLDDHIWTITVLQPASILVMPPPLTAIGSSAREAVDALLYLLAEDRGRTIRVAEANACLFVASHPDRMVQS